MKKVFLLILVLFTFTACGKKNYLPNKETEEAFQAVLEDRGLEDWKFLEKHTIDDDVYYIYINSKNEINSIQYYIEDNEYHFIIFFEISNYPSTKYIYEDYEFVDVYKENNEWKFEYAQDD